MRLKGINLKCKSFLLCLFTLFLLLLENFKEVLLIKPCDLLAFVMTMLLFNLIMIINFLLKK